MLLRDSEFSGVASWALARDRARGALGVVADGYRAEFLRLIDAAATLDAGDPPLARHQSGAVRPDWAWLVCEPRPTPRCARRAPSRPTPGAHRPRRADVTPACS
jgi:hypothetical protein